MIVDARIDTAAIEALVRALSPRDQRMVMSRALNHEGAKLRTAEKRSLARITGLGAGRIAKGLKSKRATVSRLSFELVDRDSYTTLKDFKPKQTAEGVIADPWGRSQLFESAFIVPRYGDVYRREGPKRGPIQPIFGPAPPIEMTRPGSEPVKLLDVHADMVAGRMLHEILFAFGR